MSVEGTKTVRVLWLQGAEPSPFAAADLLSGDCQVDSVATVEAAVEALRRGSFDLVVSSSADFLPLKRLHTRPGAEVIL